MGLIRNGIAEKAKKPHFLWSDTFKAQYIVPLPRSTHNGLCGAGRLRQKTAKAKY
jgi:hypothetical protein